MKKLYPNSKAYKHTLRRSHWMLEAETTIPTEPLLSEDINDADIAIIGGGFVGLWTAIFAKQHAPDKKIVILERDMCGGGASGRNGGLLMSWWSEILTMIELFGEEEAHKLAKHSERAIDDLEAFCQQHNIDAHVKRGGWLWTAINEAQLGAWDSTLAAAEKLGDSPYQRLTPEEVSQRTGSEKHLAGVFDPTNGTVQPARLVAGLKRVALELGVEIYEKTPVKELSYSQPATLITPYADVRAKKVVLASNVWAAALPELRKYITPVGSTIIVTEPIADRLAELGWQEGEGITDSYQMIGYYRPTREGRIAYGKSSADLTKGGKITDIFSQSDKGEQIAKQDFYHTYPMLDDVEIDDSWNGPIDYTNEHFPVFGHLQDAPHIIYGVGWSGNGVGPSQIGGRVLSSLALELDDEWSNSVLVGTIDRGINRAFPPRHFRYFGGQLVRHAIIWCERYEAKNKKPPFILRWIAGLAGDIGT